jgi:hypothetical protein
MTRKRSLAWAAAKASSRTAPGRDSPNQTTAGRTRPEHPLHEGEMGRGTARSSCSSPHSVQRTLQMLPCSSSTRLLPAR